MEKDGAGEVEVDLLLAMSRACSHLHRKMLVFTWGPPKARVSLIKPCCLSWYGAYELRFLNYGNFDFIHLGLSICIV